MVAFIVGNITVNDPVRYEQYRAQVPAIIAQYGGRYLVRGGAVLPVEGNFGLDRVVILEFPSVEAAQKFHSSPEYAPLLKLRSEISTSHLSIIEGVE